MVEGGAMARGVFWWGEVDDGERWGWECFVVYQGCLSILI